MMRLQLFHTDGSRKYLTHAERHAFLDAAERFPRDVHTLCAVLAWTGCRVSEALALTADRVDLTDGTIRFESVKKRRRGVFRAVPVPPELLRMLTLAHDVRMLQQRKDRGHGVRLWPWSRTTAWRHVSHSRRRRMPLKTNDLSYMAFVNIKSIESTTYAFYAASNGQVLN